MFKGLGAITSLMKQAQTMGPKMQAAMDRLKDERVTGTAGGGMVTVNANGLGHVLSIQIDPLLVEKNEFEMVTDLLPAAINQAIAKAKQLHVDAVQSVTGDIPLPGGMEDMLKNFMSHGEQPDDGDSENVE